MISYTSDYCSFLIHFSKRNYISMWFNFQSFWKPCPFRTYTIITLHSFVFFNTNKACITMIVLRKDSGVGSRYFPIDFKFKVIFQNQLPYQGQGLAFLVILPIVVEGKEDMDSYLSQTYQCEEDSKYLNRNLNST